MIIPESLSIVGPIDISQSSEVIDQRMQGKVKISMTDALMFAFALLCLAVKSRQCIILTVLDPMIIT
jgi:hypothetical protein